MPPIHGNPGRAVMLLKQLKQLTLSATLRNARFYGSPAVSESVTTSNVKKIISRYERRALVESYVSEYRAANGGKFPTLSGTIKEVGGGFYFVRNILQELKLKPNSPLPIVAKALSQVPASVPNDGSSQTLNDPQSHSAAGVVDPLFQAETTETGEEQNLTYLGSRESKADHVLPTEEAEITKYSDEITLEGDNLLIVATQEKGEIETASSDDNDSKCDSITHLPGSEKKIILEECSKNSEVEEEESLTNLVSQELKLDHFETAVVSANVVPTEEAKITTYPDESNLEGDNLLIVATHEKRVTETAPNLPEETKITSQESKVDHIEEAAVSANVEETKITSQVSEEGAVEVETGERSSAWRNIVSFAKDFANFWRKK